METAALLSAFWGLVPHSVAVVLFILLPFVFETAINKSTERD